MLTRRITDFQKYISIIAILAILLVSSPGLAMAATESPISGEDDGGGLVGPAALPVTLFPTGGVTGTTTTFLWRAVSTRTTIYQLYLTKAGRIMPGYPKLLTKAAAACPTGTGNCRASSPVLTAGAPYQWKVRSYNTGGSYSAVKNFYLLKPARATLRAPKGNVMVATGTTIALSWNAVKNAANYKVYVKKGSSTYVNRTITAAAASCPAGTGICSLRIGAVSSTTTINYSWNITTWNPAGYGPVSLTAYFRKK